MSRIVMAVVVTLLGTLVLGTALEANHARAQVLERPSEGSGVISGPQTVTGPVSMTQTLWVDGGVNTTTLRADRADIGTLDAGTVYADSTTTNTLDAGTAWVGDLNVTGRTTLKNLDVMGPSNFAPRPGGIFLPARLIRASGLLVTTLGRWVSIGTVTGSGALSGDACGMTAWPASLAILDVDYRCFVTPSGVVDFQMKAGVALTVPAGIYQAVISGPVPAQ